MSVDAIEEVEKELNAAMQRAWALVSSTEPRLFTVRPHPTAWSAAECLAHLSLSSESFIPVLREAIDDARARGIRSAKDPRMDVLGKLLKWFLEPPIRKKVKTRAPFVPRSVRAKAEAFGEFSSLQSKLVDLLEECRGLDLRRIKVVSPFDKRVRYNLYSAFKILAAHERRHLWQAEQAIADLKRVRAA
jgi:hypothetical protein